MLRAAQSFILLILVAWIFSLAAFAQGGDDAVPAPQPVILTAEQGKYPLGLRLNILKDPVGNLTIDDIALPHFEARFTPSEEETPNFGYLQSPVWARLQVYNNSAASANCYACKDWFLEISDPTIDSITLYLAPSSGQQKNDFLVQRSGDLVPRVLHDIDHHNLVFKLSLEPQTMYTLYLQVENRGSTPLPLTLWSPEAFARKDYAAQFGFGFFYGFIFIMVCYNLVLFLFLRDRAYLYYALSVSTLGLYQLSLDGLAGQHLWPKQIWWGDVSILVFIGLTLLNSAAFTSYFLRVKDYSRVLDRVLALLKIVSAALVVLSLFPGAYRIVAPLLAVFTVLTVLVAIVVGIVVWKRGYQPARYYLLAWGGILAGAALVVFSQFAIMPLGFLTENGVRIGIFLLVLLLSLALADRINLLKAQAERANCELEQHREHLAELIEERTTELAGLNQTLLDERHIFIRGNVVAFKWQNREGWPVEYVSPNVKDVFGYSNKELMSSGFFYAALIPEEDIKRVAGEVKRYSESGVSNFEHEDYRIIRKDGKRIWLRDYTTILRDDKGEITHYLGYVVDITERVRVEAELRKAKGAAEAANYAKSVFLGTMSHELRSPLNSILGFAQILQEDRTLDQHHRNSLEVIRQSGNHLLTIINDILDIVKIEMDKLELDQHQFHLHSFLDSISKIFRVRAGHSSLTFRLETEQLPAFVCADMKLLRLTLVNLLSNALKFTEKGRITLRVGRGAEVRRGEGAGALEEVSPLPPCSSASLLHFEVEDTGVGIAPEDLETIFQPFHQIGDLTHKSEGVGLGLSLCYSLVEVMGGELQVESKPGQGSIFWFDLALPVVGGQPGDGMADEPQSIELNSSFVMPDPEALAGLLRLAMMGDIHEIQRQCDALEQVDQRLEPFTTRIRQLAEDFRIEEIMNLLES